MGHVRLLAVCGLKREAAIVGGPGIVTIAAGGRSTALADRIEREARANAVAGLISIGVAGALDPGLGIGDVVVATEVFFDGRRMPTDAAWAHSLATLLPQPRAGGLAGAADVVASADGKAALRQATGAIAVDMESHSAAAAAARLGLPFAAARFISDRASDVMPPAARVAMRADGGIALGAIIASLARDLRQLPALMRLGRDSEAAFRALRRGRGLLGPTLGFPEVQRL